MSIKYNTTLEIGKLKERCVYDITEFLKLNPIDESTIDIINVIKTGSDYSNVESLIETDAYENYKSYFNQLNPSHGLPTKFDYSHDVPKLLPNIQNQMWIVRTLMFYTLLIDVSRFITENGYNVTKYSLGIFGSISATSDIDIGFTYRGDFTITADRGPLSLAIQTLEDLFKEKMGVDSLKMDIEPYADLMTYTENEKDQYYMDTRSLTYDKFLEIAPYIGAGIMRNYVQSRIDLGYNLDIRRQKVGPENLTELNDILTKFKDDKDSKIVRDFVTFVFKSNNQQQVVDALLGPTAVELISGYLLKPYDDGRTTYYTLVNTAEKTFGEYVTNKSPEKVFDLLKQTSHALIYRAESYVFSNTVMDIVRGFQAGEYGKIQANPELCSKEPNTYAPCLIGQYGYIISLLENIGYILRFDLTYCKSGDHANPEKCNKKNKKYLDRVKNTFFLFDPTDTDNLNPSVGTYMKQLNPSPKTVGGKRTRTRRLSKRKPKTRRHKKTKHFKRKK